jgi:A/G-specific adenine glycosylase
MKNNEVSKSLNLWYDRNKRVLPFRLSRDPYKIWLSEVMLHQTQIVTMLPYYKRWIKKYPNIKSLIKEPYDKVLKDWEGLGYYNRCLNFYNSLKIIEEKHQGKIPKNYDEFRKFAGVGDYTAAAVLSIAYNKKYVLIDGNVKRVLSRYLGIKTLSKHNLFRIKNQLRQMMFCSNPGKFNQSIMELGAILCRKHAPKCIRCPLKLNCKAFLIDKVLEYPKVSLKRKKTVVNFIGLIIVFKNQMLISKRKEPLLRNLWEFPTMEGNNKKNIENLLKNIFDLEIGIDNKLIKKSGLIKHTFSHLIFRINFYDLRFDNLPRVREGMKWVTEQDLKDIPCSKILYKALELIKI